MTLIAFLVSSFHIFTEAFYQTYIMPRYWLQKQISRFWYLIVLDCKRFAKGQNNATLLTFENIIYKNVMLTQVYILACI